MTHFERPAAAQRLIRELNLQPHPEGGFYRETYRSAERVVRAATGDQGDASTAIYYLLCDGAYSTWHRIRSDEVWHFYTGGRLDVHVLQASSGLTTHRLGNILDDDRAAFQAVVPAGAWFAAECVHPGAFALAGCTVAPGFEFADFELADASALAKAFPQHADLVHRLAASSRA
jgi:uncharacterized protein